MLPSIQESERYHQDLGLRKNANKKVVFSFKEFVQFFGPGLLVSMAYIDPGNLSGDLEAGMDGRYRLLWILLLSTFFGYIFQALAARVGVVTGQDLACLCRKSIKSVKIRYFLWIMCEIAIIGSDIQEVLGSAIALKILFSIPIWAGVLITIVDTLLILLMQVFGVRKIEALFAVLISTMFVCFFINLVYIEPEVGGIFEGVFVPNVPSAAVTAMVGLIGAVIMPHNLYLHSSLVLSRKIDRNDIHTVKEALFYNYIESGISLFVSFIINLTVICTFAHFSGQDLDINLENAGETISSVFGTKGKYIWAIGLLAAGQCSTISGTMAGQFVMQGFIDLKVKNWLRSLITRSLAIIPSIILAFFEDPTQINENLNILQAIQLPFAIIPLLKFSRSANLMKEFQAHKITIFILSLVGIVLVALNIYQQFPDMDAQSPRVYIFFTIVVIYVIMIIIVIRSELDTKFNQDTEYNMGFDSVEVDMNEANEEEPKADSKGKRRLLLEDDCAEILK